ncbi:antitoxin Xre/MbcA/ParS toxin-binding domain-containing protein [Oceanicella sp. SM1341]|uniref:type II RES/Xre toxin-antitoxin system antitoxin n=1 Tax=Oceanicella sp. SM1341 TaxID=1548889 RepID=UPI000E4B8768|nr:antitoxin Xre/MbcA/ParS toxin-binding domain-containing protein [Oceanicella sp. SM1341]
MRNALQADDSDFGAVAALLGGEDTLHRIIRTPLDAHEMIAGGLPQAAVASLRRRLARLGDRQSFARALGVSARTLERQEKARRPRLNVEQSARAWTFASVLARATEVLGSQAAAEQWLASPATGLDGRTPMDLLGTPAGAEMVQTLLVRMEYGVYS